MATFYDRFQDSARRLPDHVALEIQRQDSVESVTYSELARMSQSVGRWLSAHVQRETRIAILAANHPRCVAAYLGVIASGSTVVPLDTALHADQIAKLLKNAGATMLFCDPKRLPLAREAASGLELRLVLTEHVETESLPDCDYMF